MADLVSDPLAWRAAKAPSLAEFEALAGEVFQRLPKRFRDLAADVIIRVDDFPTDDVLKNVGAEPSSTCSAFFKESDCRSVPKAPP